MASVAHIRLAVLDDYAELAEKHFRSAGLNLESYHSFPKTLDPKTPDGLAALTAQLEPFNVISTMRERTPFPAELLTSLPNLKLLLTTGMRNASLDLETARQRGILVAGTQAKPPADSLDFRLPPSTHDTTTQQAISLLLSLTSRIPHDHRQITNPSTPDAWQSGFSIPLYGKTLGVIGLGKLGTNLARICVQAFGMKVICWSSNLDQSKADDAAAGAGLPAGSFTAVAKQELLRTADVVSLHLVLSDRSRGTLKAEDLALLKPSALLVNTARAGLIEEDALLHVLEKGRIAGAALDVFWKEPLPEDSLWRTTRWGEDGHSMVVLSPHMGYVNEVTMRWWYKEQAQEVKRWSEGESPLNIMNNPVSAS
ncbi:hypothetical protein EJ05DRAFT_454074 [Pseudovirgaria hyperparasitica]|uniref:D-isomer specific 2-hydroxyacid dehydrogenase NAD-binding domain-containing protein n=1 Tax=Pseudovirgaria hyperparasitica TaxID=470096 RepID=A0A6A6W2J6_9PEZI|nr:uncharacterized protein EJ05DRAFT_454074 [Pseudovirgaria hyperparasitica]KAF2757072.1 hypothetical protein EJ05DRAFT_454074 [Pseudovirgaria hyperparasitica]